MKKLLLFLTILFLSASAQATTKQYDGSEWQTVTKKNYNSSDWVSSVQKHYDGSEWQVLAGELTEAHTELFLDEENIDTYSDVSFSVNRPTKQTVDVGLADFGADADDWDAGGGCWWPKIFYDDTESQYKWRMHYGAADNGYSSRDVAFAYSDDLTNWIKPNLGAWQNNRYIAGIFAMECLRHFSDNISGQQWVHLSRYKTPGNITTVTVKDDSYNGLQLYISATQTSGWSFLKEIVDDTTHGTHLEGKELIKNAEGKYLAFYTSGHSSNDREIGIYKSDTTNLNGDWTDLGNVVTTPEATQQKYNIAILQVEDYFLGVVPEYNSVTGYVDDQELYISRDGESWTQLDAEWFGAGENGSWDYGTLYTSSFAVGDGVLYVFYFAQDTPHSVLDNYLLGYCTINERRIGQVSGNGTIITDEITVADELVINCDASGGGNIKVELLDPSDDSVLSGYSQNDCGTLESDEYDKIVLWGGKSLPTQSIKIKFYLDEAILYSFYTGDY